MPSLKDQVNFRVSDKGKAILYALQDLYGLSQSGVFEVLLRDRLYEEAQKGRLDPKNLRRLGSRGT